MAFQQLLGFFSIWVCQVTHVTHDGRVERLKLLPRLLLVLLLPTFPAANSHSSALMRHPLLLLALLLLLLWRCTCKLPC